MDFKIFAAVVVYNVNNLFQNNVSEFLLRFVEAHENTFKNKVGICELAYLSISDICQDTSLNTDVLYKTVIENGVEVRKMKKGVELQLQAMIYALSSFTRVSSEEDLAHSSFYLEEIKKNFKDGKDFPEERAMFADWVYVNSPGNYGKNGCPTIIYNDQILGLDIDGYEAGIRIHKYDFDNDQILDYSHEDLPKVDLDTQLQELMDDEYIVPVPDEEGEEFDSSDFDADEVFTSILQDWEEVDGLTFEDIPAILDAVGHAASEAAQETLEHWEQIYSTEYPDGQRLMDRYIEEVCCGDVEDVEDVPKWSEDFNNTTDRWSQDNEAPKDLVNMTGLDHDYFVSQVEKQTRSIRRRY